MIKKYNQFVKGINEEFEMGEGQPAPITKPAEPTTTPDTPTRPRPTRPGITPTEVPSEEDAPLAYGHGSELPEEEGGEYQGQMLLNQLASELGTEVDEDGSVNYEGKKINFYSETEKFHVDNKKFSTVEEVVDYLGGSNETPEHVHDDVLEDEPSFEETEGDLARRDLEDEMGAFESKSYRHTRLKKFGK